jgi:hypothetical protein
MICWQVLRRSTDDSWQCLSSGQEKVVWPYILKITVISIGCFSIARQKESFLRETNATCVETHFVFNKLVYNLLEFPLTHKLIKMLPININEFPPPPHTHTHTNKQFLHQQFLAVFTSTKLWSKISASGKCSKLAGIKISINCYFN